MEEPALKRRRQLGRRDSEETINRAIEKHFGHLPQEIPQYNTSYTIWHATSWHVFSYTIWHAPGDRRDLQDRRPPDSRHREARSRSLATWWPPRGELLGDIGFADLAKHRRARLAAACQPGETYDSM
jgi:hypothetical protein